MITQYSALTVLVLLATIVDFLVDHYRQLWSTYCHVIMSVRLHLADDSINQYSGYTHRVGKIISYSYT